MPDPDAGETARADIDQDVGGAPAVRQRGDHRDQPFGVPAPDQIVLLCDHPPLLDQGDRAGRRRGLDHQDAIGGIRQCG
jgi:hypothetical protein